MIRAELPSTRILVLSAHVEVDQAMELLAGGEGIGYLLKSRVTDVAQFLESLDRIAEGGSVVDPALVQELVSAQRRDDPLARAHAAGARGARADGRGTLERGDRPPPLGHRGHGGEARPQYPREAAAARNQTTITGECSP